MARTAATEYAIGWEPQPGPQTALLACPVFEVFFGGARGGGKTDGMLGEWASHADLHGKNAVGLMVRRERVQLLETIERSRQIYGPIGARYNDQDKMWRWPNGARLRFAYLERDADADAFQGHSYTRVYVEELGTFPSASLVLRLMATLRSGEGVPCGFRATGNPGGPGHQWVKARYIDPNPAGWEIQKFTYENPWTRETIEQDRVFIPSKLRDNKFLGPEYVANLQMVGSDTLVRAWLEGDWTVIEGAYFDCWRYDQHVVEPFEVPAHWARFRSMDWGSAKPFSVGWWAIVGDDYAPCGKITSPRRAGAVPGVVRGRGPQRRAQDDRRSRGRGDRPKGDWTIRHCATECSIPRASRRMAGLRSLSGSTRSLLRLVCGHFTPQTIPASRTGDQWVAGISCAPA